MPVTFPSPERVDTEHLLLAGGLQPGLCPWLSHRPPDVLRLGILPLPGFSSSSPVSPFNALVLNPEPGPHVFPVSTLSPSMQMTPTRLHSSLYSGAGFQTSCATAH